MVATPEAGRLAIRVAAGVLADDRGRVLIARRPDDKHAGGAWEFPGGKLQPGETAEQALVRELAEELGVQVTRAETLIDYTHHYADRDVSLFVFRVLEWENEARGLESRPLSWVAVEDLMEEGLLEADQPIVDALRAVSKF